MDKWGTGFRNAIAAECKIGRANGGSCQEEGHTARGGSGESQSAQVEKLARSFGS